MKFISPMWVIEITLIWVLIFVFFLLITRKKFVEDDQKKFRPMNSGLKKLIFWLMVIPIILSTVYVSGMTIRENIISVTKGPVHWHADYEVWACGEKLDLVNPIFPRNKIGSPLLHEHEDDRIHVEGTVNDLSDVSLSNYFFTIGGSLENGNLVYPTIDSVKSYSNGQVCADGTIGEVRVYVNGFKIENYEDYVLYPDSYVPAGDCIIVDFSSVESVKTNKLCASWVAKKWDYNDFERTEKTIGGKTWQ